MSEGKRSQYATEWMLQKCEEKKSWQSQDIFFKNA